MVCGKHRADGQVPEETDRREIKRSTRNLYKQQYDRGPDGIKSGEKFAAKGTYLCAIFK